ncbi:amidohydrolase family protein [Marinigracilibium pacificum]|uniref:Amidohydrolase family protein n=1 Tax=Marinigracilibium pacificum TaxID=2729599 RepID=A0A848IZV6_9BACT|nr:amidohydrolase family protein [Marinigracilibium pacificum]NMM47754.1 amidohydrolase family protein [Marinigracilibium pacificum]
MKSFQILFLLLPFILSAQDGIKPIIDVHVHGYTDRTYRSIYGAPSTYEEFKAEMKKQFQKFNIVYAMKSGGSYDSDMEEIMLQGYESNNYPKFDTIEFKNLIEEGKIQVWGEFLPMFNGMTIADPGFAPYLKICEREGIPIALHTGSGPPGISYRYTKIRLTLGDPLLIEEVLINYPKLKIYLMHSGGLFYDHALAIMELYPQVYCGLGAILWIENSPTALYAEEFLSKAKKANMIDRIMFGSDGMYWPNKIEESIKRLDSFEFLTEEDKRKIFYENAVKFFELDDILE